MAHSWQSFGERRQDDETGGQFRVASTQSSNGAESTPTADGLRRLRALSEGPCQKSPHDPFPCPNGHRPNWWIDLTHRRTGVLANAVKACSLIAMKTIFIVVLNLAFVCLGGCANMGSSFFELSIAYPSDAVMRSEGEVLVEEITSLCKDAALSVRGSVEKNPSPGGAYATFRTVSDREPIIWVTIYRVEKNEVRVAVSSLKRYESSSEVRSLLSSIEARMKMIADQQGRAVRKDRHGSSPLH